MLNQLFPSLAQSKNVYIPNAIKISRVQVITVMPLLKTATFENLFCALITLT